MRMLAYAQKVGLAVMVPVATLPAAALLTGIGHWLDPNGSAHNWLATLFTESGMAILNNMALLFAVGTAFGLSKDKHGSAALSGFIGWLVVTTLLEPHTIAQLRDIPEDQIPFAFHKIKTQFTGIIIGIISGELYNRLYQVELPSALSFFSGKRLVPIAVSIVMIAISFILLYIWPPIFNGLIAFGQAIEQLGAFGAGLYGFFNRLLIPVGLHHILNSVFWFDVAGINDIPNFLGGAKSIADGKAIIGVTGIYQAGFFPVMMFGLPAAALALYHSAPSKQGRNVGALLFAASLSSFFTGVTEPLEFSFMFAAPLLYVLHAILTGLSLFIAASMQWISGFGFSAGLVDMLLQANNPLANHWYMLLVQGLVFGLIYYALFRIAIRFFKLQHLGFEDRCNLPVETKQHSKAKRAAEFIEALGGKDNLKTIDACITRLRLTLYNRRQVNFDKLKALGAKGVIKVNNDGLQVVLGTEADLVAEEMKQQCL